MFSGIVPEMTACSPQDAASRRLLLLCAYCVSMGVGHALLWLAPQLRNLIVFYLGYIFAGLGFGGVWPIMVCVAADVWGLQHLGANYMVFDGTTAFVGALVLGKFMPQAVYSTHADGAENHCEGPACFGLAHLTEAACCIVAAVSALLLWQRRRPRSDIQQAG